jgi:plasmid stabilization system protein ParE
MGNAVHEIRAGYRCFVHGSHAIFYTRDEQDILIVRILHKRMDAGRNLQE